MDKREGGKEMDKMKKICWVVILCFFFITFTKSEQAYATENNAIENENLFRKYDLETGETELVSMSSLPSYKNGERVTSTAPYVPALQERNDRETRALIDGINWDDVEDTTDSPYYAIARLEIHFSNGATNYGTGYMVSGNVMLTAGHCVFLENNSSVTVDSIIAKFGLSDTGDASTLASVKHFYVCSNYTYYGDDYQDDYAILVMKQNVGDTTGWFGLDYEPDSFFENSSRTFSVTGYANTGSIMMTESGNITDCDTYILHYMMDTVGGQSGSPVYRGNSTSGYTAYGIHVGGSSAGNGARRMTQELFDWLVDNDYIS